MRLRNPHPGKILAEEFLKPKGISQAALARAIRLRSQRISEIVQGKRAITAELDRRLARYLGVSEGFFVGLQADFDRLERQRQVRAAFGKFTWRGNLADSRRGRGYGRTTSP